MHREGHIESGSGYSSGGGTSSGPRRTNRTPIGSAGTDMGSGMMGNPTMGGGMMMGIVQSDGSTMTPMGLQSSNRNINLPMSSALPINVNENTPNVQQIQSFPVVGTGPNGIHFHQDPITGQMYRMTQEFHQSFRTNYSSDLGTVNNLLNQIKNSKNNTPIKLLSVSERSYDSNIPTVLNSIGNYINLIDNSGVSFSKTSSSPTKAGNVIDYINTLPSSNGILKENEKDNRINNLSLVNDTSIQIKKDITVNKFADTSRQINYRPFTSETSIPVTKFADTSTQINYRPFTSETSIPVTKFADTSRQINYRSIISETNIRITRLV